MAASLAETARQAESIAVRPRGSSPPSTRWRPRSNRSPRTRSASRRRSPRPRLGAGDHRVDPVGGRHRRGDGDGRSSSGDVGHARWPRARKNSQPGHRALTAAVNETAAAIEEMSHSIAGVADNADDLAAAAEETSSSINEMAASIEEVGAMTESLATAVEQNSTSIEQMSRSVQSVAASGRRDQRCRDRRGDGADPDGAIDPIGRRRWRGRPTK